MTDDAVELLFRVLVDITRGTRRWVQRFYLMTELDADRNVCGTAYCLAGHIVVERGHKIAPVLDHLVAARAYRERGVALTPGTVDVSSYARIDMELGIADTAAGILGIEPYEAAELFHMTTPLSGLWELAGRFSDGRITIPDDLRDLVDDRVQTPIGANA